MEKPPRFASDAWLLRGISSLPGELKLAHGRLAFIASGSGSCWGWQLRKLERQAGKPGLADRIDAGENARVFELPLADVKARFPWYYFSGGLVLHTPQGFYKLSFGQPANTRAPGAHALGRAAAELGTVRSMRTVGQAWRRLLPPD